MTYSHHRGNQNGSVRISRTWLGVLGAALMPTAAIIWHGGMTSAKLDLIAETQRIQGTELRAALDSAAVFRLRQRVNEANIHLTCVVTHSPCKEP